MSVDVHALEIVSFEDVVAANKKMADQRPFHVCFVKAARTKPNSRPRRRGVVVGFIVDDVPMVGWSLCRLADMATLSERELEARAIYMAVSRAVPSAQYFSTTTMPAYPYKLERIIANTIRRTYSSLVARYMPR